MSIKIANLKQTPRNNMRDGLYGKIVTALERQFEIEGEEGITVEVIKGKLLILVDTDDGLQPFELSLVGKTSSYDLEGVREEGAKYKEEQKKRIEEKEKKELEKKDKKAKEKKKKIEEERKKLIEIIEKVGFKYKDIKEEIDPVIEKVLLGELDEIALVKELEKLSQDQESEENESFDEDGEGLDGEDGEGLDGEGLDGEDGEE